MGGLRLATVARLLRNTNGQLCRIRGGSQYTFAFTFLMATPAKKTTFLEAAALAPLQNFQPKRTAPLSPESVAGTFQSGEFRVQG